MRFRLNGTLVWLDSANNFVAFDAARGVPLWPANDTLYAFAKR